MRCRVMSSTANRRTTLVTLCVFTAITACSRVATGQTTGGFIGEHHEAITVEDEDGVRRRLDKRTLGTASLRERRPGLEGARHGDEQMAAGLHGVDLEQTHLDRQTATVPSRELQRNVCQVTAIAQLGAEREELLGARQLRQEVAGIGPDGERFGAEQARHPLAHPDDASA